VRTDWGIIGVVAAGGVLGALARYGLGLAFPYPAGGFPWATFAVNVSGCLLIGALLVLVTEAFRAPRLVRPFLGTGVLGGYTTFSTAMVDTIRLLDRGAVVVGLLYLFGTLLAALLAVYSGATLTRRLTLGRPR
jgi:CrcB protein